MEIKEFVYREKNNDDFIDTSAFKWCEECRGIKKCVDWNEETSDKEEPGDKDVVISCIIALIIIFIIACLMNHFFGITFE